LDAKFDRMLPAQPRHCLGKRERLDIVVPKSGVSEAAVNVIGDIDLREPVYLGHAADRLKSQGLRVRGIAEGKVLVGHVHTELRFQHQGWSENMGLADAAGVLGAVGPQAEARHSLPERREIELKALEPASEEGVLRADTVIDTPCPLVEVRGVGSGGGEIRGARTASGQRHELVLDLERDRVQPRAGNDVIRKRLSGSWIIDGLKAGEVALPLSRGWHDGGANAARAGCVQLPHGFPAAPEEQPVVQNRTADVGAKLILDILNAF